MDQINMFAFLGFNWWHGIALVALIGLIIFYVNYRRKQMK